MAASVEDLAVCGNQAVFPDLDQLIRVNAGTVYSRLVPDTYHCTRAIRYQLYRRVHVYVIAPVSGIERHIAADVKVAVFLDINEREAVDP